MAFAEVSQNWLGPLPIHYIVIQYPQRLLQMAFCDLSHTFHKQVTIISQHVCVILLWGIFSSPLTMWLFISVGIGFTTISLQSLWVYKVCHMLQQSLEVLSRNWLLAPAASRLQVNRGIYWQRHRLKGINRQHSGQMGQTIQNWKSIRNTTSQANWSMLQSIKWEKR